MLARPLAPSACSWMKFEPAASWHLQRRRLLPVVPVGRVRERDGVRGRDAVDHQLRVAQVRGRAAERVAPDQPCTSPPSRPSRSSRWSCPSARIAVGEARAGVAGDRRAPLARIDLAVDRREPRLVLLDDGDPGPDRRSGAASSDPPPPVPAAASGDDEPPVPAAASGASSRPCRRPHRARRPPRPATPAPVPAAPGLP